MVKENLVMSKIITKKSFENAIKVKPDYAEAYNNLGMIFSDQLKFEESNN